MKSHYHQLAVIMFTDIVGYTKMMGLDEEIGLKTVHKNREIHKTLIEKHNGKWIKEMGDGVLAQFDSAYNATCCAIAIQQKAKKELNGKLRIGLHLGEVLVENGDIFGDGVNVASRIESITEPGGIFISEAVFKALKNRPEIRSRYIGEVALKNVEEPVKVYCIEEVDVAVPSLEKIQQLRKGHPTEKSTFRRFFRNPVFSGLLILLVIGVFTIQKIFDSRKDRTVQAIAILPFANFTGSEEEQYFVDMMHDAVITEVSRIGDLIVKSRTSVSQFKESNLSIPEIAKILNVDAILESSVSKTGDSVHMNVQLIQTRPVEDHIWADYFESDTRFIKSMYGELAKSVARAFNVQLTPLEDKLLTDKREVNPEAYKLYLNGQFHWNKLTKEDLDLAEKYFLKAVEIDPDYAEPYLGLSGIGGGKAQMGLISQEQARKDGEQYLQKALELDSGLWEARRRMAFYNIWGLWDFKKGMKEFRTTLQLNPSDAKTRAYYAQALCIAYRDHERADKEGAYAIEIDPLDNLYKGLYGQTLNLCRKFEKAERIFMDVLDSDPYNAIALSNLKTTYHMQKKHTKAYELWKTDNRKDSLAVMALENGYQAGGYQGALQAFAEYSIKKSSEKYVTPWRIFTIYVRAGMKDESLEWLQKAYEIHDPNMPYISTDPIFDYLREEPEFQNIVRQMNFPEAK